LGVECWVREHVTPANLALVVSAPIDDDVSFSM
jgi:hypothetical protein